MTRVAVVGAGAWGTTLASLVSANAETILWAREPEVVASIRERAENVQFLPGFTLPCALEVTGDLREAIADADLVVFAVPAQHLRSLVEPIQVAAPLLLNVAKGLEQRTCMRMSEVLGEASPGRDPRSIGVLSGPNLAREIMGGQPAATCVAFPDVEAAQLVQQLLMTRRVARLHERRRHRLRDRRRTEECDRHRGGRRRWPRLRHEHEGSTHHTGPRRARSTGRRARWPSPDLPRAQW